MKSRTFYSAIAVIASIMLVIGIAGFWGLTAQNPRSLISQGGQTEPIAAQFVPRQAPFMASLLARPDRLWQLRQLLTPARQRFAARQEWQSLKQTLVDTLGWDYDTDVRPWLDQEISVAVTTADLDHDRSNGLQTGYLVILGCQDAAKAKEALHVLWQKRAVSGRHLVFETVAGVSLIYDQLPTDPAFRSLSALTPEKLALDSLATALVGNRQVLLANDPQVIRQAIATYQAPDISLARATNYRESLQALPANRIGWLYANVPPLLTWLGLEAAPPVNEPVSITQTGRRAQALFLSFRALPTGLLGDTALTPAPGNPFPAPTSTAVTREALQLLPPETLFATTGKNLAQLLTTLNDNIGGYGLSQRSLASLLNSLSLPASPLPPNVLATFDQEYALGLIGGSPPTWLLISQGNGHNTFNAIDALAQAQGINVSHVDLGGQDITAWTRLSLIRTGPQQAINLATQVMGVHTTVNGYEVFANTLTGLAQVLQQEGAPTLLKAPDFAQLTRNLPASGGTLTYINWPTLAPTLLKRFLWLRVIADAGQPLTGHLGPILIQGYDSRPSRQEGRVAIKLRENP